MNNFFIDLKVSLKNEFNEIFESFTTLWKLTKPKEEMRFVEVEDSNSLTYNLKLKDNVNNGYRVGIHISIFSYTSIQVEVFEWKLNNGFNVDDHPKFNKYTKIVEPSYSISLKPRMRCCKFF